MYQRSTTVGWTLFFFYYYYLQQTYWKSTPPPKKKQNPATATTTTTTTITTITTSKKYHNLSSKPGGSPPAPAAKKWLCGKAFLQPSSPQSYRAAPSPSSPSTMPSPPPPPEPNPKHLLLLSSPSKASRRGGSNSSVPDATSHLSTAPGSTPSALSPNCDMSSVQATRMPPYVTGGNVEKKKTYLEYLFLEERSSMRRPNIFTRFSFWIRLFFYATRTFRVFFFSINFRNQGRLSTFWLLVRVMG